MSEKEILKEKDIGQIVRYLCSAFNTVTGKIERPYRSKTIGANQAYKWQTEFAYRLNEIIQGPRCLLQNNITKCNEYIDEVLIELNRQQETEQAK